MVQLIGLLVASYTIPRLLFMAETIQHPKWRVFARCVGYSALLVSMIIAWEILTFRGPEPTALP